MGDREADIFDLFALPRQANSELLMMLLTYRARLQPDESCETVLATAEWQLLRRKFEPKNRSKQPPTLDQAVGWIARLGGF